MIKNFDPKLPPEAVNIKFNSFAFCIFIVFVTVPATALVTFPVVKYPNCPRLCAYAMGAIITMKATATMNVVVIINRLDFVISITRKRFGII